MFQTVTMDMLIVRMINRVVSLIICIILYLLISFGSARAQDMVPSKIQLSLDFMDMPLNKVLSIIEHQTSFKFAYNSELVAKQKNVTLKVQNTSLSKLLLLLFKNSNISYSITDNQIILQEMSLPPKITISGYIKERKSGELLPSAIIYLPESKAGASTNGYGFYSITTNQSDSLELMISYVGYKRVSVNVNARKSFGMNFNLAEDEILLDPVLVRKDKPDDNVKKYQLGKTEVSADMVKTGSTIIGSGDIISSIQMLPGVMAGLDGSSGYFVRGGNADQNLVQLDEATLYNPSHLLGLVSIFNTSVIRSASLLKGGFPASYGDHLSSVLDVSMKEGNNQQVGGDLQIGTTANSLTFYGPIIQQKASFLLSVRRSTIDLLFQPLHIANFFSNYYFYDLNAKINFQLSLKDRIYLSLYQGRDKSSYSRDSTTNGAINYGVQFGNQALTLRWNHLYSQKLFSNTSLIHNNYYQSLTASHQPYYANLYSGIRDMEFKTDLNYYPNTTHKISTGVNYLYQALFPATVSEKALTKNSIITINPSDIPRKHASRLAVYFSDDVRLSSKFSAYFGARIPLFYNDDVQYLNFEPRFTFLYLIDPTFSLKLSYTQMHQYLHLAQSYNASFPAEIWIGSSKIVKPQYSQQASIGLFKNFKENMFQSSVEIYYKEMGNQLLFKSELQPTIDNNIESTLIFGKGQAYGAELFITKSTGKLTGWLAYTLSYANQQFDSLNLGKQFPFANDRRHCLYVSASYAINLHWKISSNLLFTSGRAITLKRSVTTTVNQGGNPLYDGENNNDTAEDILPGDGTPISIVTTTQIMQNNYRLAPYNRLDLSINYTKKRIIPGRVIESEWVFSVYNVYAHANTFFAYRSIDPVTKQPIVKQVSFVPIIPSLSYNFKF